MEKNETLQNLIRMVPSPVKVSNFAEKGVLSYQVSVPAELKNIVILDASTPIRDLVHFDRTVMDAEEHLPRLKTLGVPLSSLKRYDGTMIYRMRAGGGKGSMTKSFKQIHTEQRQISREVVQVLKQIPQDQTTLLIAFKPVYEKTGPVNFVKILEQDITDAKVATMKNQESLETAPVKGDGGKLEDKPRVSITTWGLHKGTNKYAHCQNLIMVGIVHRDLLDLFGNLNGQMRDLNVQQTRKRLLDLQLSEVAHDCFQAIGRIRCRTVVDGVALPVNIWLIHYSSDLEEKLEPVLQGATWRKWETKYDVIPKDKEPGKIEGAASAVSRHFDSLAAKGIFVTGTRAIRSDVEECRRLVPQNLTRVTTRAVELNPQWLKVGQRYRHVTVVFPPEAPSPEITHDSV